ncbi:MAG: nucleoside deaminase, partial [Nanoarchaeota archaeon]|nr:nucleoside deaminase [Nanoarchaeota archaeon]
MLKMSKEDFMKEAIKDAKDNNRSFGAIIVKDNKIISKAGKLSNSIPICHPETQAIFNAIRKMSKNLGNCTLYSTCEPCAMCFYMAWLASIDEIVYGASLIDSIVL